MTNSQIGVVVALLTGLYVLIDMLIRYRKDLTEIRDDLGLSVFAIGSIAICIASIGRLFFNANIIKF